MLLDTSDVIKTEENREHTQKNPELNLSDL